MYPLIEKEPIILSKPPVTTDLSKLFINDQEVQRETQVDQINFLKLAAINS